MYNLKTSMTRGGGMNGRGCHSLRLLFFSIWTLTLLLPSTVVAMNPADNSSDCSEMVDAVFLIDSSWSVRKLCPLDSEHPPADNWRLVLDFVSVVVGEMPLDSGAARVGFATFSTSVSDNDVIRLDQMNVTYVKERLVRLPFLGGNTNTTGALRFARDQLRASRVATTSRKQYVILLTDGANNVDGDPVQEARLLKQDGIRLITVGISDYVDEAQLKEMATAPADYSYIYASDFSHLNLYVGQLLDRLICANPPPAQPCRDSRADIAFVLDASGSIIYPYSNSTANYANWNLMKAFVVNLIRSLKVSANETRIALVLFSHEASIIFRLNSYSNPQQAIEAVNNLSIVASSTNTSSAISLMVTTIFSEDNGDRPDVNNVGIIITDGQSDSPRETAAEALAAKKAGVRMYAIGLTDQIDANELRTIASAPLTEHYFNRTSISLVQTVTSQLLWSVCHSPCQSSSSSSSSDPSGTSNCRYNNSVCHSGERVSWIRYSGHLLLGRSYAILRDVTSPIECQNACLLDNLCRSVQFIASFQQCSISYYSKDQAPDSFRTDSEVDYYEIVCVTDR